MEPIIIIIIIIIILWNLLAHTEGGMTAEGSRGEGAKDDIWMR
jgi:hypothetical protein